MLSQKTSNMPFLKSSIPAILLSLTAFGAAQAQSCGGSITYPNLQSVYTYASTDVRPFCLEVAYSGCNNGQTLEAFLTSPDGSDVCTGYVLNKYTASHMRE